MSHASPPSSSPPGTQDRPPFDVIYEPERGDASYRIGKRSVQETRPDGSSVLRVWPLTPEDHLHPLPDDEFVVSYPHFDIQSWLHILAKRRLQEDPGVRAFAELDLDLGVEGIKPVRPDFILMENVRTQTDPYLNFFHVSREASDLRLRLVLEVTSARTFTNDLEKKVDYYDRAGVEHYVIVHFDDHEHPSRVDLREYRFLDSGRENLVDSLERHPLVRLEELGVRLGFDVSRAEVRLEDLETGELYSDYFTLRSELEDSQRREELFERRLELQARQLEVEREARRLEGQRAEEQARIAEAERQRAEEQTRIAEAERQARQIERQRADELQRRLEQLQRRMSSSSDPLDSEEDSESQESSTS